MPTQRWEYERVHDATNSELDVLGKDGWELVAVSEGEVAWLKRPLKD
jgi:hypothetical protein